MEYSYKAANREIDKLLQRFMMFVALLISLNMMYGLTMLDSGIAMNTLNIISILVTFFFILYIYFSKGSFQQHLQFGMAACTVYVYLSILIFPGINPLYYMFFLLIPVTAYIFLSFNIFLFWLVIVSVLIVSGSLISPLIINFFNLPYIPPEEGVNFRLYFTASGIISVVLYHFNKLQLAKKKQLEFYGTQPKNSFNIVDEKFGIIEKNESYQKDVDAIGLTELFYKINIFFSSKPVHREHDLTLRKVADQLGVSESFASKALNFKGINFKQLLNSHRINEIKSRLDKFEHEKYTLSEIHTSSGFKHQTTFNRVFKEIVGVTPREYMKGLGK